MSGHDFDVPARALRAFFIDARWQGRGFGTLALSVLVADLAGRHPAARLLALAVSRRNHTAVQLYRRAGFVAGGELYHGGRSGPQCLMLRPLP